MFNRLKEAIISKEITIPLTEKMLKMAAPDVKGITNVKISIDQVVIITGIYTLDKFLIKKEIPFEIHLQPTFSDGRVLFFNIPLLKPLNWEIVKKYALNNKYMTYSNKQLSINLNAIEAINTIPVGKIKKSEILEKKLVVTLGL